MISPEAPLACPWCDNIPEIYYHKYKGPHYYLVRCTSRCPVSPKTCRCETEKEAVTTWNKVKGAPYENHQRTEIPHHP